LSIDKTNFIFSFFISFFTNTKILKLFIDIKNFFNKKNKKISNVILYRILKKMNKLNVLKYQKLTLLNLKKRLKLMTKVLYGKNNLDYKIKEISDQVFEVSNK